MTLLVLTCKIVGTTSWFHSKASLWVWYGCVANGNAVNRSKMYARSSRTSWNQRAVLFKQEPMQEVLLLISGMSYMRNTTPRISSENRHHEHQKNIKAKKTTKSLYWSPYSTFEYAHLSEWPAGHVQLRHPNHTLRWDWADHPFRQLTSALALLINQASKRNWQVIPVCSEGMRFLTKQESQIHKTSAHPEIATLERLFVQECGGRLIILGILQKGRSLRWFLPQMKT